MNFLDSLLEKVPFLRDIEPKKRKIAAILLVFIVISLLGTIIDAIAEAGGAIALTAVAVGFLLMAVIIVADYFMSRRQPKEPPVSEEPYNFFDDSPGDTGYQDDSYEYYNTADSPREENYDGDYREDDYGEGSYDRDADGGFRPDSYDDGGFRPDGYDEYSAPPQSGGQPEPQPSFRFDRQPDRQPEPSAKSSFSFAPEHGGQDFRSEPVMRFDGSQHVKEEVAAAAATVAPNIVPPPPVENIGGPVMSIPYRGGYHESSSAESPAPVQPRPIQVQPAPVQPQPIQVQPQPAAYAPTAPTVSAPVRTPQPEYRPAYAQRPDGRGKEIEEFFDHMSDDELLYSDCVEVWAADAKPAAIRLLKQVESLSDKKMADALGREAEYINAMLDRIYYFTMLDSVRENLELKEYNFSAVVKECLRRFSPFFMEKRIGLLWKGLDINIITDKRWLVFALTQIVFNAVEFTGLGGKIAISAKKEGSLIHLMVDDNGCGIAEDDMPKIFMAGYMGDNAPNESGRRTGMGLFIARSVVEKLGGTVTAESTLGKGTRITMILPEKP